MVKTEGKEDVSDIILHDSDQRKNMLIIRLFRGVYESKRNQK